MLKRCKASFMIFVIIFSVFTISLIKPASAADVCCEKTVVGTSCVNTDDSNCDKNYNYLAADCTQTNFCRIGCCVASDGRCHSGVPEATCVGAGGQWSSTCDIEACKKGCCVVKGECSYVNEKQCDNILSDYEEIEKDFRSVNSEEQCGAICRGEEEGCCVDFYGCSYGSRESCYGSFNYGHYCREYNTCDCEPHDHKDCYDNNVYWFDSCGNREELTIICDYNEGFICKEVGNDYKCTSINCEATYVDEKNVHDDELGGLKEHGESWCIYESPVGDFRDRPGTRHYRHMCIDGEEISEPCRDYREEICIQNSNNFTESQCLYNDIYDSKITQRISTVPAGFRFWEQEGACSVGDIECKVVYVKKNKFSDFTCVQNCHCEKQEWTDDMAEYCKSLGDCGADYNILGIKTTDGFSMSGAPKSPSSSQWDYWREYGVFGGMKKLGEVMEKIWVGQPELPGTGMGEAMIAGGVAAAITTGVMWAIGIEVAIESSSLWAYFGFAPHPVALAIVAVVAVIAYFVFSGEMRINNVVVTCSAWQAPSGGDDCEKCDEINGDCTEYRCKSLGQLCEFIPENVGSERVTCYNAHPNDINSPKITIWNEILTQNYNIQETVMGYKIIPEVEPYRKITFGIKTDEMAQCRFSEEHKNSYEEMPYYFGEFYYSKEHEMSMNLDNGREYDFYIRCKDPAGNENLREYAIHIKTAEGPDLTSSVVDYFEPGDGSYVPYNISQTAISAFVNEPAECRWDYEDRVYENMREILACEQEIDVNDLYYECLGVLNVASGENLYYIKCKDASDNINDNSFIYHLYGSEELRVTSSSPSGILYDTNSPTLQIKTIGSVGGISKCYFSTDKISWIEFFETDSAVHSQSLSNLKVGDYTYHVECFDDVNEATGEITFRIDKDISGPHIDYVFSDSALLHIVLNEDAVCEYSDSRFSFGEGTGMSKSGLEHTAPTAQYLYVNCEDVYGNKMGEMLIYT